MARNQFGCICDMCGKITNTPKEYYKLTIPVYQNDFNNSTQTLDYCFDCYMELKALLQIHYTKREMNKK
jgi:hypothetical protein